MFDTGPVALNRTLRSRRADSTARAHALRPVMQPPATPRSPQELTPLSPPAPSARDLELVMQWSGEIADLKAEIENVSDWMPFELVEAAYYFRSENDLNGVYCRFVFHGAPSVQKQYEHNLSALLLSIARWEEI